MVAIGIDLGTTYSAVGVMRGDKVEIIANDQGNRTTPSYVAFNDTERLIGDAAKNQAAVNSENTIFDAKRLIGNKFNDPKVQSDMRLWPFKVEKSPTDSCIINVNYKGERKTFQPEEISSMILTKMKETATQFIAISGFLISPVISPHIYYSNYLFSFLLSISALTSISTGFNYFKITKEFLKKK